VHKRREATQYLVQAKYEPYVENEQALVCLANREIVDASRGRTFHCKVANNRLITFFSLMIVASFI